MATIETRYLPSDRLASLASGISLPSTAAGSVLFADISGFTPITEKLRLVLGARRGAEALTEHLNRIYNALTAEVERFGGSIVSFSGDAITCWFAGENSALTAVRCGAALLAAMRTVDKVTMPDSEVIQIGLKVAIASGSTRRFVVGDSDIQQIDTLAGSTVARVAAGEEAARRGEMLADEATVQAVGHQASVQEWRETSEGRFAVLDVVDDTPQPLTAPLAAPNLGDDQLRPWILPAVSQHLQAGLGEYLTELRPAVTLFVRFTGIDYEDESDAETRLNAFVSQVQRILSRYEGIVLQLTIGDKGSYLSGVFGAPYAHEDDVSRALNATLDIRQAAETLPYLQPLQIGISQGLMRTGAYGSETRRTYGVMGDEVNLSARLMMNAAPGQTLISSAALSGRLEGFAFEALPPLSVKGKTQPVSVSRLIGRADRSLEQQFYTTPLVGRDTELNTLVAALEPLFQGKNAGIIYVHGEPGIGKSRLVHELQQREHALAPITWLIGQTDDILRAPLQPFAYLFSDYFEQRRDRSQTANLHRFETRYDTLVAAADEGTAEDLRLYRSFMAGLIGLLLPNSLYETANEKLRLENTIAVIKAFTRAVTRQQPLIIHIEDGHWLDSSSIRALQNLTYGVENVPFAILLTSRYRDDGTPFLLDNLEDVPTHKVDMERLHTEGVRQITETIIGGTISESLVTFIVEKADGNPFFTEQLILALKERGALRQTDQGWTLATDAVSDLPSGINALLISRIDRLAAQVKAVVQTASVLGREFDVTVLSRMLRPGDQLYVKAAEDAAIWNALNELRYLFRHALLRDAAYQMQVQSRLKELHRMAGELIETLYPDDPAQDSALLEHWLNAGVPPKALRYLTRVASRQIEFAADYDEAERLLDRAEVFSEGDYRPRLLFLRGRIASQRGQFPEAQAAYQECLDAAGDDETLRVEALNGLSMTERMLANYQDASAYAEQALALARARGNQRGAAQSLTTLAEARVLLSEYEAAHAYLDESTSLFHEVGDLQGIAIAFYRSARAYDERGDLPRAKELYTQSHQIAQQIGDRKSLLSAVVGLGIIASRQGDLVTAETHFREGLHFNQAIGERAGVASSLNNLGALNYVKGDYPTARTYFEQSASLADAIGDRRSAVRARKNLADILGFMGEYEAARVQFQRCIEVATELGDRQTLGHGLHGLAVQSYNEGNYALARTQFEDALRLRQEIGEMQTTSETLEALADTTYLMGDTDAARGYIEQSEALAEQVGDRRTPVFNRLHLAEMASDGGDHTSAAQLIEEGLSIAHEIDDEVLVSDCLHARGLNSFFRQDYAAANRDLDEAARIRREAEDGSLYSTLVWLARVRFHSGTPEESRLHLTEAAEIAQVMPSTRAHLTTLIGAADLRMAEGQYDRAAELVGLLLHHPYGSVPLRRLAGQIRDVLEKRLEANALTQALQRGSALDVKATLSTFIAELRPSIPPSER